MNNFEKIGSDLSDRFLTRIKVLNSKEEEGAIDLRFQDLDEGTTFKFRAIRHFSSTSIKFIPDAYSLHSIEVLEEAIKENIRTIKLFIDASRSRFSRLRFEIGNEAIIDMVENKDLYDSGITYEAKVFSEESNFHAGQLNQAEFSLFEFTFELFLIFLRLTTHGYKNADEVVGYPEGATTVVSVNKYERNPKNRKICIEHHGLNCQGCGFNFFESYGELGDNFIIVHHLTPVSKLGPDYVIDPKKDLVPLCANCHAIVHRVDPPISLDDLRKLTHHLPK